MFASSLFASAIDMIVSSIAQFFMGLLLLRFAMQMKRVPFHQPFGQFVLKMTNWLVLRLRRLIPAWRSYDLPSLVGAWLVGVLITLLHVLLMMPTAPWGPALFWGALLLMGVVEVLRMMLVCLMGCLIVQAVLSWTQPYHSLMNVLKRLTAPLLQPVQKLIPPVQGFDLSPMVLLLLGQVLLQFFIPALSYYLLRALTFGMFI